MSREALSYIPISVAVCRLPCVAVDNRKLMALSWRRYFETQLLEILLSSDYSIATSVAE